MDYQALYQQKLVAADLAVKTVKSGDWVDYGWCTNHPVALDRALAARKDELTDVKVRGGVTMWMPEICKAEDAGEHFTWHAWHMSGIDRKIAAKGMGYFIPMRYSELPRFYREDVTVDVAMLQVTPMDSHGNFNFGLNTSHLADMLERAKIVIVEVNRNMPWVNGLNGSEINIRDVDFVVEGENPPIAQLGAGGEPTDVDRAVAELIVPEIPNGACLQLGIGGMPNTIGSMIAQSDLKDLGVHTEVFSDNLIPLIEAGVITGKRKSIDTGKITAMFIQGSADLYKYVDRNVMINIMPGWYTNNPVNICKNDNVCAINACLQVDLTGQVNCEWNNGKIFSGVGGQSDFLRGAGYSKGGKPILCLPSTAKGGTISRIVPLIPAGVPVSTARIDVHWVVTEYGAVNLFGLGLRERGEALIGIAHPKFRDQLQNDFDAFWREMGK